MSVETVLIINLSFFRKSSLGRDKSRVTPLAIAQGNRRLLG
jgi:hypothetical protein